MCKTVRFVGMSVASLLLCCLVAGCPPEGEPTIDEFVVQFDLVSVKHAQQGVAWKTSEASAVELVLEDDKGGTIRTKQVPADSNGMHNWDLTGVAAGEYKLYLVASNSKGKKRDYREFILVGEEGIWFSFEKRVERPGENQPWFGFQNAQILVTGTQGLDNEDEVISVSEGVRFSKLKWQPKELQWADREGCTAPGLYLMMIKQKTHSLSCDKKQEYPFPSQWSTSGSYLCAVNWSPCNFGIQGTKITYHDVTFLLYLRALPE